MKIAVAGTGYVGLVTGVTLADIGHHVTCIDTNKEKIDKLKKGICPIYEENIEYYLKKNKSRISFTTEGKFLFEVQHLKLQKTCD